MSRPQRVLLIENFASDFYKARLPLAEFLLAKGWDVYALIPDSEYTAKIVERGIKVLEYKLERKNKGILQLMSLLEIYRRIIKENDIDIVHSFRFQPNLLNTLANCFNHRKVILHITGLGIVFSNNSFKYRILRFCSQLIFMVKLIVANVVIVQNAEDASDIWLARLLRKKVKVINGSGVDTTKFDPDRYDKRLLRDKMNIGEDQKVFICVTRLIWEKGIREMVDAFESMTFDGLKIKLLIVGWPDYDNPRHVDDAYINARKPHTEILFLGKRNDIAELLAVSDVCIYPSYYREGIPRSLLEALAMKLPVITTDMPGCNLTVLPGRNGLIVEARSSEQIKKTVCEVLSREDLFDWGEESRRLAISSFSNPVIFTEIEKLY